jgi:5-methylcytosine-specific restriction enzyme subunit McrC
MSQIPIKSIFYLLSYVDDFSELRKDKFKDLATEHFDNILDLCTAILTREMAVQIKRGLRHAYVPVTEALSSPKGRIEIGESVRTLVQVKHKLVCSFDEYSVDSYLNRIVKTTLEMLKRSNVKVEHKAGATRVLRYLQGVQSLNPYKINWHIRYDRNDSSYRLLISICYLAVYHLLQMKDEGKTRLMDYEILKKFHLYEKFILGYYEKKFPELTPNADIFNWNLSPQKPGAPSEKTEKYLPIMHTDITLHDDKKTLIIDAKFYENGVMTTNLQGEKKLNSNNLYQIVAYVKNRPLNDQSHKVSGMLLYARTDEDVQPPTMTVSTAPAVPIYKRKTEDALPAFTYDMSNNIISVRTLDLNCKPIAIAAQLNAIVEEFFGIKKEPTP